MARRQSAAAAQLPHAFDALRASFGFSGPCVKPYDMVGTSVSTPHLTAKALCASLGFLGTCVREICVSNGNVFPSSSCVFHEL